MSLSGAVKRELTLAACLIGGGLLLVPLAVYWVGLRVVGNYESDAGLWGLLVHIWSDFLALDLGAWLLVLSPYLIVQLLRVSAKARLIGRGVTQVTDSHESS